MLETIVSAILFFIMTSLIIVFSIWAGGKVEDLEQEARDYHKKKEGE